LTSCQCCAVMLMCTSDHHWHYCRLEGSLV